MAKLKLTALNDEKPVRVTLEMRGSVHRDLLAYAQILAEQSGHAVPDVSKLIVPMVERFMATDREFARNRRLRPPA